MNSLILHEGIFYFSKSYYEDNNRTGNTNDYLYRVNEEEMKAEILLRSNSGEFGNGLMILRIIRNSFENRLYLVFSDSKFNIGVMDVENQEKKFSFEGIFKKENYDFFCFPFISYDNDMVILACRVIEVLKISFNEGKPQAKKICSQTLISDLNVNFEGTYGSGPLKIESLSLSENSDILGCFIIVDTYNDNRETSELGILLYRTRKRRNHENEFLEIFHMIDFTRYKNIGVKQSWENTVSISKNFGDIVYILGLVDQGWYAIWQFNRKNGKILKLKTGTKKDIESQLPEPDEGRRGTNFLVSKGIGSFDHGFVGVGWYGNFFKMNFFK